MTSPDPRTLLHAALKASGLSQAKFAASPFFGPRGISLRALSSYLRGEQRIPKRLAHFLEQHQQSADHPAGPRNSNPEPEKSPS